MKKSFFNKTILGNFVFINEENKSKEIQGKNVLSFTEFVLGGFCPGGLAWGFFVRGVFVGRFMSGGFCPVTTKLILSAQQIRIRSSYCDITCESG